MGAAAKNTLESARKFMMFPKNGCGSARRDQLIRLWPCGHVSEGQSGRGTPSCRNATLNEWKLWSLVSSQNTLGRSGIRGAHDTATLLAPTVVLTCKIVSRKSSKQTQIKTLFIPPLNLSRSMS